MQKGNSYTNPNSDSLFQFLTCSMYKWFQSSKWYQNPPEIYQRYIKFTLNNNHEVLWLALLSKLVITLTVKGMSLA